MAEADDSNELNLLRSKIHESLGIPITDLSHADVQAVKTVAHAIGKRAARLAGMAIGAVVLQSGRLEHIDPAVLPLDARGNVITEVTDEAKIIDVGVDGSVIELYPRFEQYLREALKVIEGIGPSGEKRIRIGLAKDGSSIGTAIVALLAAEQLNSLMN